MSISVYKQLTSEDAGQFFSTLRQEIGMKTNCIPFAMKVFDAFQTLPSTLSDKESRNAANVFLSQMQTLWQGGILPEDYDKIDFVKRSKTIVPSARVEAFMRAAARKGYRITDSIIPVPKEDMDTTYFEENFCNGDIVYVLKDARKQTDRGITAQRCIDHYFEKFLCRLDIHEVDSGKRLAMVVTEIYIHDLLEIVKTSEQGFYKSKWEKYKDFKGIERNRKVVTKELDPSTIWSKFTGEMVAKTVIRRALKRVKEVLPELKETIYAFESEPENEPIQADTKSMAPPAIPMEIVNVDMRNFTEEQKQEAAEMLEVYKANPKMANDDAESILARLDGGISAQEVVNDAYASLSCLFASKKWWPKLEPHFIGEVS